MKAAVAALVVIPLAALHQAGGAQQMGIWDFGPDGGYTEAVTAENVMGTPMLVLAGGEIDVDGKDGVAYTDVAGVFHSAGQAAAWDDVKVPDAPDADWIVTINTTGWYDISIRFDYRAWDPTTTSLDLDYRLSNSGAWAEILNNETIIADNAFHGFACPLGASIENQPIVQLRFYDLDRTGNGKFAFDNLELNGTAVPEPGTILLVCVGAAAVLRPRKKMAGTE